MIKKTTLLSYLILASSFLLFKQANGHIGYKSGFNLPDNHYYIDNSLIPFQENIKATKQVFQLFSHGRPGELLWMENGGMHHK